MTMVAMLLAEFNWTDNIGLILLPLAFFIYKLFANRDQKLIDKGKSQANYEAFRATTVEQTRTITRWMKRQLRVVNGNVHDLKNDVKKISEEFVAHEANDKTRFEEIKQHIDDQGK